MPTLISVSDSRSPPRPSPPGPFERLWRNLRAFDAGVQRALHYFWRNCAAAFFALLFGLLAYEAAEYRNRFAELAIDARPVTGTIVSISQAKDRTWVVGYTFTDTDGRRHNGLQGSLPSQVWAPGAPVVVRYSPRNPNINAIMVARLEHHATVNMRLAWLAIGIAVIAGLFQIRRFGRSAGRKS